jgi:hypothetical protein
VIIAGAGGAAHLPGMAAAMTRLPVLGVPVESKALSGLDSLLSIVQMPGGVPVGPLAIGKAGAINAGCWRPASSLWPILRSPSGWKLAPLSRRDSVDESPGMSRRRRIDRSASSGGGQLGRMLAWPAAQLRLQRPHLRARRSAAGRRRCAARFTRGDYDDGESLARFGASVDVATYEFENISAAALDALAREAPLYPPRRALEIAQDRLAEKEFALAQGGRPAPFAPVEDRASLDAAIGAIGLPAS